MKISLYMKYMGCFYIVLKFLSLQAWEVRRRLTWTQRSSASSRPYSRRHKCSLHSLRRKVIYFDLNYFCQISAHKTRFRLILFLLILIKINFVYLGPGAPYGHPAHGAPPPAQGPPPGARQPYGRPPTVSFNYSNNLLLVKVESKSVYTVWR